MHWTDKIKVTVSYDDDASVAHAEYQDNSTDTPNVTRTTASSKRHPSDRPNDVIGPNVAIVLVLRKLADDLENSTPTPKPRSSKDKSVDKSFQDWLDSLVSAFDPLKKGK
jgi:hypothetical protein